MGTDDNGRSVDTEDKKWHDWLDALDALAAAATKGPWETTERPGCVRRASTSMTIALCGPAHGGPTDAAFIAATRQAVPVLVAAVRAALAVCEAAERGVGYRVPGDHSTWDGVHEGRSDLGADIEEAIEAALDVTL